MKRKQFLNALTALPILAVAACEKGFPSTPTVVTGKVIDENGLPVEDFVFSFSGTHKKNILNAVTTFSERNKTDKDGIYKFSVVIPQDTDFVEFVVEGYENDFSRTSMVDLYIEKNSIYEIYRPIGTGPINYGSTNTFNFQIKKR